MALTQIADVVVPAEFTAYLVENSMVSTALYQSGVVVPALPDETSACHHGSARDPGASS
jgi:hypothetical protein